MSEPGHAPFDQTSLKHGEFCWTEIASTDAKKCKEFYSKIFGWKFLLPVAIINVILTATIMFLRLG